METPFKKIKEYKNVHIGSIPVMVKSKLCNLYEIQNDDQALANLEEDVYDKGGYFIINGAPKIIASQQRTAYNKIYIFANRKDRPSYKFYAEVRSSANSHSTTTYVGIKDGVITAVVPYIENTAIPIGILFHALGVESYDDILNCITPNRDDTDAIRIIELSLEQSCTLKDQDQALCYIGKRGKKFIGKSIDDRCEADDGAVSYARHLLTNELFPHTGVDFEKKKYYLGLMIRNLINVHLGRRGIEDRDHYANKRIATVGILFRSLFYTAFRKLRSEITNALERCVKGSTAVNIISLIKPTMIRSTMCNALTSNVWGGRGKQQGISQTFDRFNHVAGLANARKFITPMSAEGGKVEGPRHLHNSHWGVVCPAETPEGKKCGLVTNASMQCLVTIGSKTDEIEEMIRTMNIIGFEEITKSKGSLLSLTKIFINGDFIAVTKYAESIVNELRGLRRSAGLNPEVSIYLNKDLNEVHVLSEPGRVCRPLLIVEKGKILLGKKEIDAITTGKWDINPGNTWSTLLSNGYIELIDKLEEESTLIATFPSDLEKLSMIDRLEYTHCELHPSMIFGIGASIIPHSNTNQSPRNTYQCLWEEELVLMANGSRKAIKDVKIGDFVVTFNPETLEPGTTKVIFHHLSETDKNIVKITTVDGRRIVVTEDHKMMTDKGWVEAGKITDERVAIMVEYVYKDEAMKLLNIFCHVQSIVAHPNVMISDITTESGFHSFVGGDGFCVHNSSMAKQAVGVPGTNYLHQTKGKFHVLNYPQKPLVTTKLAGVIGFDKLPAGQNAVVMVCPWYGFGQEDSIIMNQDSIDRGFMAVTTFICFDGRARKDRFEKFEIPCRDSCSNYKGNNSKLDHITGTVTEGQIVNDGDILIGITSLVNEKATIHQHQKISISVLYDQPISGRVHKIQFGEDGDGYEYVRIVIAQLRTPEYGDKFAAFPGQKGTVGMTFRSYDLPFTKDGIAPDILINPLALPSRMTIGLLIEIIQGRKIASSSFLHSTPTNKVFRLDDDKWNNPPDDSLIEKSVYGPAKSNGDGTPFNKDFSLRKICDELKMLGINEYSDELVINGQTGEQMECLVFTGICFYQRLKHMVVEKVHARSRGGRTRLTRQPREGRRIGGGFRVGVMEKDALLGNGAPHFTKDRLMEQSDEYRMWFCEICGLQAIVVKGDAELGIPEEKSCRLCENNRLFKVRIPYATKLLMQEFAGMNVMMRVLPSEYKKREKAAIMMGHKLIGEGTIE